MYKKFFRAVYQERTVFYYFKNKEKVPQNGENAYLAMKNPSQLGLTLFVQLHCASLAKNRQKKIRAPHNQILDLPLASLHTFRSIYLVAP